MRSRGRDGLARRSVCMCVYERWRRYVLYVGMRASEGRSKWSNALVQRHVTYVERRVVIIGKLGIMRVVRVSESVHVNVSERK